MITRRVTPEPPISTCQGSRGEYSVIDSPGRLHLAKACQERSQTAVNGYIPDPIADVLVFRVVMPKHGRSKLPSADNAGGDGGSYGETQNRAAIQVQSILS